MENAEIRCINCGHVLPSEWILATAGKLATASRKHHTGPQKKYRPCTHCGELYGAQELRYHQPRCDKNPNPTTGRPRAPRPCPWCERSFGYTELLWHRKRCTKRPGSRQRRRELQAEREVLKKEKKDG